LYTPIQIHDKQYVTVAERVQAAHEGKALLAVKTDVLSHNPVVIRAEVTIQRGAESPVETYTGISSVNPDTFKQIEKTNPYEVAETSALGRALGFAGYGIVEGIASADEIVKAERSQRPAAGQPATVQPALSQSDSSEPPVVLVCETCGEEAAEKAGVSKSGRPWKAIFCSSGDKSHVRWL